MLSGNQQLRRKPSNNQTLPRYNQKEQKERFNFDLIKETVIRFCFIFTDIAQLR